MSKAEDAIHWQEHFEVMLAAMAYACRGHLLFLKHRARKGVEFPAFEALADRLWACVESRPEGIAISEGDVGMMLDRFCEAQAFPVKVAVKSDVDAFGRPIRRDWWRVPVSEKQA